MTGRSRPRRLPAAALAVAGALAGAAVCELAARGLYDARHGDGRVHLDRVWGEPSDVPGVYYRPRRDRADVNEFGFRYGPLSREKPAGVFRVFVLGDSMTFGASEKAEHAYPAVLETLLRSALGENVQVVNAGVPMYDIHQESALMRRVVAGFSPDLVILGFFANDLLLSDWKRSLAEGTASVPFHRLHEKKIPRVFPWLPSRLRAFLIWNSLAYEAACVGTFEVLRRVSPGAAAGIELEGVGKELAEESLKQIIAAAERAGARFCAVHLIPTNYARADKDPSLRLAGAWIRGMAEKHGFPLLDAEPVFRAHPPEALMRADGDDDIHPNPFAHRLIAEALAAFLKERGLLPEPGRGAN